MTTIKMKRGIEADLPVLEDAEFGFCTDTKNLYIGSSGTNVLIANFDVGDAISYDSGIKVEAQSHSPTYDLGSKSTNFAIDFDNGNTQKVELTGNVTVSFSNVVDGAFYNLIVKQGGSGSYTITWPATAKHPGGSLDLSTAVGSVDMISIYVDGADYLIAIAADFS